MGLIGVRCNSQLNTRRKMKFNEFMDKIKAIIDEDPRWIDGIATKELKERLESEKGIKCSIPMLNKVMLAITDETPDGYDTKDGNLVMGDEHENGDSRFRGIHKYWWFIT